MKLTFLGTGTSIGVPAIGCDCEVCCSNNSKDKRLRASAMIETESGLRVLIDCGPDFRQQIIRYKSPYTLSNNTKPFFEKIDAVLFTHVHYDHVGGTDDLRPFAMWGDVDIYAQQDVIDGLHSTMPYCFQDKLYPGVPRLNLHAIRSGTPFVVRRPYETNARIFRGGSSMKGVMRNREEMLVVPAIDDELTILPIRVMHGKLPILGFRFGKLAYLTDMKSMREEDIAMLEGVEVLIVNALRFSKEHHSHQLVSDAIALAERLGVKQTYFTHLTHDIGTHEEANARLPKGFAFAFDGQVVDV